MIGLGVPVSSLMGASPAMADTNFPCGTKGTYTVSTANVLTTFSEDCTGAVTIDPSVTSINSKDEFLADGITSIAMPATITSISFAQSNIGGFFAAGSLETITVAALNPSFTAIDGVLFNKSVTTLLTYPTAKKDTSYSIPNTVTKLDSYSFNYAQNLLKLKIPTSLAIVSDLTFYNTSAMTEVTVDSSSTSFKSLDGVLYSKDGSYLYYYPESKSDLTFTIPNTVTEIGGGGIEETKFLQSIIFPAGLKTLNWGSLGGNRALTSISDIPASVTVLQAGTFTGNSRLLAINVDSANPNFKSINGVLFDKTGTTLIAYPSGATNRYYTVPSTVSVISSNSFSNSYIEYLSILQTTTVEPYAGYLYAAKFINYCSTNSASKATLANLGTNNNPAPKIVCDTGLTISSPASDTVFQMTAGVSQTTAISVGSAVVPYTVGVSAGTLPAGLRISPDSTSITGIPTTAGTFSGISITATDVFGYSKTVTGIIFNVAAAKAASPKKITITCTKGKVIKKVAAVKPVCPKGYKKK